MCYAYGDKDKSRTSPDVRPTRGRKDSNGGSTSHPRTDTLQVYGGVYREGMHYGGGSNFVAHSALGIRQLRGQFAQLTAKVVA